MNFLEYGLRDSRTWFVLKLLLKLRQYDPKISLINAKLLPIEKVLSCRGVFTSMESFSDLQPQPSYSHLAWAICYMHTYNHVLIQEEELFIKCVFSTTNVRISLSVTVIEVKLSHLWPESYKQPLKDHSPHL